MWNRSWLFVLALLGAASSLQAEKQWVTNQAARLVIGQTSFTRQNPTPSRDVIGAAAGVAVGGNRLFIADGNRIGAVFSGNRTLIYNDLDQFVPGLDAPLDQGRDCPACLVGADIVLGQANFTTIDPGAVNGGMQAPSGVATDGQVLAVADTNNNRVLLWLSIPQSNNQPPDVVLGQADLTDNMPRTSRQGMRGPQGVWVEGGRLFVADTQNSRILIWNQIPTSNGQAPDLVLGQPDFDSRPDPDLTASEYRPSASNMLDPTAVTVKDGKMFVADLGFDRVLIFLTIPTQNHFPADVVVGQPDFETSGFFDHDNNPFTAQVRRSVAALCEEIGPFDDDGTITPDDNIFPSPIDRTPPEDPQPRLPKRCESTFNFPRFALSDGQRLYIADSGNDRVLIYNEIPQQNGAAADVVLGQPTFIALENSVNPGRMRAPTSLAHDGENLYVAEPFTRRVLVYTPAEPLIASQGIVNGASFTIRAGGHLEWNGATTDEGQLVTVTISGREYEFRTETNQSAASVRDRIVDLINADADSLVIATPTEGPGFFARGSITFGGSTRVGDRVVLRINGREYVHTVLPEDTPTGMVDRLNFVVDQAQDPQVIVDRDPSDVDTLTLTARGAGTGGNIPFSIEIPEGSPLTADVSGANLAGGTFPRRAHLTAAVEGRLGNAITVESTIGGAGVTASTSGSRLTGGSNAQHLPAGTFAALFGQDLADQTLIAEFGDNGMLPTELGGVRVFTNGKLSPLYSVSAGQINFQVPWTVQGAGSSVFVRRTMPDGTIVTSSPRANDVTRAAPGLFAHAGIEPRRAVAVHAAGPATGSIAITRTSSGTVDDENVTAGVTVTIRVNGREYSYQTQSGNTLDTVRDRLIDRINSGDGDPEVTASAGRSGFFSARATVTLAGDPNPGDVVTISVRDRDYVLEAEEGDTAAVMANILVQAINSGRGDPEVTARRLEVIGAVQMQVIARELGTSGNDIPFDVSVSDGAAISVSSDVDEDGTLSGGQTPPVVVLTARQPGVEGNSISYAAQTSDASALTATARQTNLCCGNIPFSLITDENPAIPGETIIVFGSGLGLTSPRPSEQGLESGEPTPDNPDFNVPFVADDFVSSLAGGRTATVEFVGLMPGQVGIYQINLRLNEQLPDDPNTPLDIAQVLFISNTVTIPVKNLVPRDPDDL